MQKLASSIYCILGCMGLLVASMAYASPKYHFVTADAEVIAEISMYESNRIAVKGDRIASIVSSAEGWDMDHNKITGDVFLVPSLDVTAIPVNVFITTEAQHTYKLILMPVESPAQQVILFNGQTRDSADRQYGQAYYSFVADKIKAIATNAITLPVSDLPDEQSVLTHTHYKIRITHMGIDGGLSIYKGILHNISTEPLHDIVDKMPFRNRLAVWTSEQTVAGGKTCDFVLVTQGGM